MALTKVIGEGIGDNVAGKGSIVQVVATTVTAGATTALNAFNVSWAEIQSAYRCAITPKSADNFLLLDCQFCFNQHEGTATFIEQIKFYDITNSADVFVVMLQEIELGQLWLLEILMQILMTLIQST